MSTLDISLKASKGEIPVKWALLLLLLLSHFSRVRLCATPEMAAHQAPPSLGFSRQEHCSGLPFASPMQESEKWRWSHSLVPDSQRPHGLQPTRLLRPMGFARQEYWNGLPLSSPKWALQSYIILISHTITYILSSLPYSVGEKQVIDPTTFKVRNHTRTWTWRGRVMRVTLEVDLPQIVLKKITSKWNTKSK